MRTDDGYKVVLRGYGDDTISKSEKTLTTTVGIQCKYYDTFKKIVDAILPILESEEK